MQNEIEYKLINNFRCKRCGCIHYDKMIYTGMKTLDEEDAIIHERYVCRNCDFPFNINDYIIENEEVKNITTTPNELLNESVFVDEGTEIQINGETIKKENKHE